MPEVLEFCCPSTLFPVPQESKISGWHSVAPFSINLLFWINLVLFLLAKTIKLVFKPYMLIHISRHVSSSEGTNPSVLHKLQLGCMMPTWIPTALIGYVVKLEQKREEGEVCSMLNFAAVLPEMFQEQWDRLSSRGNGGVNRFLHVSYVYHFLLCVSFKLKNILRSSDKRWYKMKSDDVINLCIPSPSRTAAKSTNWSLH